MTDKLRQAFTLVELLVVIAIVGILSGLIIVGMSSSVESANLAKAQIFSSSLRDSLLASLVSEWKLDEGTGSTAADSWNSNTGTLYEDSYVGACDATHCPQWRTTGCVYDDCLLFDGLNDYVEVAHAANLEPASITVEAWVKLINDGNRHIVLAKWTGYSFEVSGPGNPYIQVGTSSGTLQAYSSTAIPWGKWSHIAGTFDSSSLALKTYVNGLVKGTNTAASQMLYDHNVLRISNTLYASGAVNGLIDNVRIYNSAIPASQIKEHYYAGLNRLLAKNEVGREEYENIISN